MTSLRSLIEIRVEELLASAPQVTDEQRQVIIRILARPKTRAATAA